MHSLPLTRLVPFISTTFRLPLSTSSNPSARCLLAGPTTASLWFLERQLCLTSFVSWLSRFFPLSRCTRHLLWHIFDVDVAVAAISPLLNPAVAVSLISALLENAIRSGSSCTPSQSPPPLCLRLAGASPRGEVLPQPALSLSLCERLPLNSVYLSRVTTILAVFGFLTRTPINKRCGKDDLV